MIIITGSVDLEPHDRKEGFRLGCEHSARSRSEPGCLSHNCYEDAEQRGRMHFFEKWESAEAVQAHFALPASRTFIAAISGMAIDTPKIEIYSAQPVRLPGY